MFFHTNGFNGAKMTNNWFYKQTYIGFQESKAQRELKSALDGAHNRRIITVADRQLLQRSYGRYLYAINMQGRRIWARALCSEFSEFFDLGPSRPYPGQQLFFVTLADKGCATGHDATAIDIPAFIRKLRRGLKGLSYIAIIEPAYYVNIVTGAYCYWNRAVFWHLHAVCWGASKGDIKARIDRLNRMHGNYRPLAQGLPAAHAKRIPKTFKPVYHLGIKFRYMLKSPKDSYRLFKRTSAKPKGATPGRPYTQKKSRLRPGERVTLFHLMKDLYLDKLAFAGGQGTEVLRRAKRRALQGAK